MKNILSFIIFSLLFSPAYAVGTGEADSKHLYEIIVLLTVALIFSALHFFSATLIKKAKNNIILSGSFGSGMAIAYVFIKLMPELDKTHKLLGESVNFIMLIGFSLFYILEHTAYHYETKKKVAQQQRSTLSFSIRLLFLWLYSWLLVFTLIEYIQESILTTSLYVVILSLHVISNDHSLMENNASYFIKRGRYILALAPLFGGLASILIDTSNLISDILIGFLAGFIMFRIFNEELPDHSKSNIVTFIAGVCISTIILEIVAHFS